MRAWVSGINGSIQPRGSELQTGNHWRPQNILKIAYGEHSPLEWPHSEMQTRKRPDDRITHLFCPSPALENEPLGMVEICVGRILEEPMTEQDYLLDSGRGGHL